ncbi:MAG: TrkA family potassium uptake protein [Thermodesulfobacteriota bacterium]
MGRFAVIGLGNFGSGVARTLYQLGHEVICVDKHEPLVNLAQEYSTVSLVGQATDMELLSSLQVPTLDAVFISLGDRIADSVLATLHLVDLEAKRIVVKIISEDHGRIVKKIGAHDVVFPERDMAVSVANQVSSPSIINYLELSQDYSIQEVIPPADLLDKTLAETGLRRDFGVNVIGVKDVRTGKILINPAANFVVKESDLLIVIGRHEDLARLAERKSGGAAD